MHAKDSRNQLEGSNVLLARRVVCPPAPPTPHPSGNEDPGPELGSFFDHSASGPPRPRALPCAALQWFETDWLADDPVRLNLSPCSFRICRENFAQCSESRSMGAWNSL